MNFRQAGLFSLVKLASFYEGSLRDLDRVRESTLGKRKGLWYSGRPWPGAEVMPLWANLNSIGSSSSTEHWGSHLGFGFGFSLGFLIRREVRSLSEAHGRPGSS